MKAYGTFEMSYALGFRVQNTGKDIRYFRLILDMSQSLEIGA